MAVGRGVQAGEKQGFICWLALAEKYGLESRTMIGTNDLKQFCGTYRVLERADDFIYLLPHPGLQTYISNYTITFPRAGMISDCYTVIPHGSATLVFSCGGEGIHSSFFGPSTLPGRVGVQANQSEMLVIVEFQPTGSFAFTGVKQKELSDCVIPFEFINSRLNKSAVDMIGNVSSIHELINGLDGLLLSNIYASCPPELLYSVQNIIKSMGNISVKNLSCGVYYSERHMNRMFDHHLGMNIKTFSRLVRINKAIRFLNSPQNSITDACNLSGFYDLSHFIHDFKSVCGLTPLEYRNRMSDFYSEISKF